METWGPGVKITPTVTEFSSVLLYIAFHLGPRVFLQQHRSPDRGKRPRFLLPPSESAEKNRIGDEDWGFCVVSLPWAPVICKFLYRRSLFASDKRNFKGLGLSINPGSVTIVLSGLVLVWFCLVNDPTFSIISILFFFFLIRETVREHISSDTFLKMQSS